MRLAIVRQRYTPFGGAERFVERALAALAARGVAIDAAHPAMAARRVAAVHAAHRQSVLRRAPVARLGVRPRRVRAAVSKTDSTWCSRTSASPAATSTAPATDVHRAGSTSGSPAASALERLRVRASPYHRYVLAAERGLFASRGSRPYLQFADGAGRDPPTFRHWTSSACRSSTTPSTAKSSIRGFPPGAPPRARRCRSTPDASSS